MEHPIRVPYFGVAQLCFTKCVYYIFIIWRKLRRLCATLQGDNEALNGRLKADLSKLNFDQILNASEVGGLSTSLSLTHSVSIQKLSEIKIWWWNIRNYSDFFFSFSSFVFHLTSKFSRRGHRSVRQKWSQDGAKTFGPPVVRDLEFHQKVYLGNPLDIFCKIILRIFIWCLGYVPCKFYLYRFMAIRM